MSKHGHRTKKTPKHAYLSGNFAPATATWAPTPVTWTGHIPEELYGGMYVRNGGNPVTNDDLGREAHWFDGDGMLSGVWFDRSTTDPEQPIANFVNQFILTDVYLSAAGDKNLKTPILPSIATLVNPASSLFFILWRIVRTVLLVILSYLPGSAHPIKRISVANTSVLYHDGRALATCESGPPIRVTLPELETVGWFDGRRADGEDDAPGTDSNAGSKEAGFGGAGPLSWMGEWTTGHPKVDPVTDEMVLFHCDFIPPYVHYSLIPTKKENQPEAAPRNNPILSAPVPGCSGGRLMHDFGVSRHHTVILDLPLSLTPLNLAMNKPVVCYEPEKPSRFGVFPRHHPDEVRWFEANGCCIFHTANTWDEYDANGVSAVNLLACRLTSASLVFSAGNIQPPPHPSRQDLKKNEPMSFFARYDDEDTKDPEKHAVDETSSLLSHDSMISYNEILNAPKTPLEAPISFDEEEECRLYYYRFSLSPNNNCITHQFALAAIPFEFPTVSPLVEMDYARYIYGTSTTFESFGAALGKATKIDILIRMDVKALLARAQRSPPEAITGCIDNRTMDEILTSTDPDDPIKAFKLPPHHYGQEARFIPRRASKATAPGCCDSGESNGYLIFYVFDERQLGENGECRADAKSELWVLDANTMDHVVCKIQLPTRIPYGLHGNWFTEEQIKSQRSTVELRCAPKSVPQTAWSKMRRGLIGALG
ncbi:hypothetical protein ACN47E_000417 [Coniothyrium glycines]